MDTKKYRPYLDKMFPIILVPTLILLAAGTVVASFAPISLAIMIPVDLLSIYCLFSPLFGYVELRDDSVYIKYGLIAKREIPYQAIRGVTKERKIYADGMISLKYSLDHVNIKYNSFDVTSVSVIDNDEFIKDIEDRISNK